MRTVHKQSCEEADCRARLLFCFFRSAFGGAVHRTSLFISAKGWPVLLVGPRLCSLDWVKYLIKPNVGKHKKKPTQGPLKTTGRCQVDFVIFNLKIFFFPILGPLMLSDSTKSDYQLFWTRFFHSRFVVIFTIFFCNMFFLFSRIFPFLKKQAGINNVKHVAQQLTGKDLFPVCVIEQQTLRTFDNK